MSGRYATRWPLTEALLGWWERGDQTARNRVWVLAGLCGLDPIELMTGRKAPCR